MKKILKTAFVAAGVVGTVGAVSTAEAASFNVVVDKIEVFTDGDDVSTGVTIYDPANNVGATTTTTVDLFNAAQKTGTVLPVAIPPANTYETVLLHISTMEVSGSTVSAPISTTFVAANTAAIANPSDNTNVLLALGNVGGATAPSVRNAYGVTAGIPMQPTTVSGEGFTFPALNLELDEAAIDDTATTADALVGDFPTVTTVARGAVDNADVPNMEVAVNWSGAFDAISTTASYTSGTSVVSVGLFDTAISARPYDVETVRSSTSAPSGTVEFVDVVSTTVVPLAWLDANNNGKLDSGEYVASALDMSSGESVANLAENLTRVDLGTAKDVSLSINAQPGIQNLDEEGIDEQAVKFGARTQSIVIAMPTTDVTATQDNNGWDALAGLTGAVLSTSSGGDDTVDASAAAATLTVIYEVANGLSRTVVLPAAVGADDGATDGNIVPGEDIFVGLATSTTVDNVNGLSWAVSGTAGALTVANIPLAIDNIGDNENTGTYAAEFKFTFADADDDFAPATFGRVTADGANNVLIITADATEGDVSQSADF